MIVKVCLTLSFLCSLAEFEKKKKEKARKEEERERRQEEEERNERRKAEQEHKRQLDRARNGDSKERSRLDFKILSWIV